MRIILYISLILTIKSCTNNKSNVTLKNEVINKVLIEVIRSACETYEIDEELKFISIVDKFDKFDEFDKNVLIPNFNKEYFIKNSEPFEHDLSSLPKIDNIEVGFIEKKALPNVSGTNFSKSAHIKYEAKYGNNYCKSLIISKPRILIKNSNSLGILIKVERYYEYPIEEYYYLVKIVDHKATYERLNVSKKRVILN